MNTEKTQVVWIGKKKYCKEKLLRLNLQWDTVCSNMLGKFESLPSFEILSRNKKIFNSI